MADEGWGGVAELILVRARESTPLSSSAKRSRDTAAFCLRDCIYRTIGVRIMVGLMRLGGNCSGARALPALLIYRRLVIFLYFMGQGMSALTLQSNSVKISLLSRC
jgi:hypothetical protein